jgi:hypothetical protein
MAQKLNLELRPVISAMKHSKETPTATASPTRDTNVNANTQLSKSSETDLSLVVVSHRQIRARDVEWVRDRRTASSLLQENPTGTHLTGLKRGRHRFGSRGGDKWSAVNGPGNSNSGQGKGAGK